MLPDSALCIDCRVGTLIKFELIQISILCKYLYNKVVKFKDFFSYIIKHNYEPKTLNGSYFVVHANSRNVVQIVKLHNFVNLNQIGTSMN